MSVSVRLGAGALSPARANAPRWRYPYEPTPRQTVAHRTHADERFYGGAAGGGKSEWELAELVRTLLRWRVDAVIFRRRRVDLLRPGGLALRLRERIPRQLATENRAELRWTFRNGAVLELGYLERDADVLKYQGAEYGVIAWDELTQFTEYQYLYMLSRLRVSAELEAAGFRPHMLAAANPGGPGHGWVKGRFIDPAPPEVVWRPAPTELEPRPGTRVFIPATVDDNPHVGGSYIDRLDGLPDDERRALKDGDWDVYAGQRFRSFRRNVHVIDPEQLPLPLGGTTRLCAIDYGFDAPFCALWGAVLADDLIVVYRELYEPGLTPRQQAEAVLAAEAPGERRPGRPVPTYLDPSTWAQSLPTTAPAPPAKDRPPKGSIAREYVDAGLPVRKATNNRLAGVALVADKLRVRGDGRPRLLIYNTCRHLIRTLPALPRSPRNPEDVDTDAEDHAYDALRYLLMAAGGHRPGGSASKAPPTGSSGSSGRRLPPTPPVPSSSPAGPGPGVSSGMRRRGF